MEILLIQDVESLGKRGDLVNVAKGYYRNFLGPKGMAILASEGNRRRLADEDKVHARKDRKNVVAAEALKEGIDGVNLEFKMQVTEEGHLYGSVSEQMIAKELKAKDWRVDASQIALDEHIKELGEYEVKVVLHRGQGVEAAIKVKVIGE